MPDALDEAHRAARRASRILPTEDVLGPDVVREYFGRWCDPRALAPLARLPFTDGVLGSCAGTHVLVAGLPLRILDLRATHPALYAGGGHDWYDAEPFAARERVSARWFLIRKDPAPDESGPVRGVARACELLYAWQLFALATGGRLEAGRWLRTGDATAAGYAVEVACLDGVFEIGADWGDGRLPGTEPAYVLTG